MTAAPSSPAGECRTLVLGLGNDLLADDAIGLLAARALAAAPGGIADVRESSVHGVALLDELLGYDRVILIDAICSGHAAPGTVTVLDGNDLGPVGAPSPHYAGIPEMLDLAGALDLHFPQEVTIVAVEVADPLTIGGAMTPEVLAAVWEVQERVAALLAAPEPTAHESPGRREQPGRGGLSSRHPG